MFCILGKNSNFFSQIFRKYSHSFTSSRTDFSLDFFLRPIKFSTSTLFFCFFLTLLFLPLFPGFHISLARKKWVHEQTNQLGLHSGRTPTPTTQPRDILEISGNYLFIPLREDAEADPEGSIEISCWRKGLSTFELQMLISVFSENLKNALWCGRVDWWMCG